MLWAVIQKDYRILGEGDSIKEALQNALANSPYKDEVVLEELLVPYEDAFPGNLVLTNHHETINNHR